MQLAKVQIHNFRGIIDESIDLKAYSLLVGPNNSGKSTVLNAIRAFYGELKFAKKDDMPLSGVSDSESWIELSFTLTVEEYDSLADHYKVDPHNLRVRRFFQTNSKNQAGQPRKPGIYGYVSNNDISDDMFYGANNVQNGKFGNLLYVPALSKVDDHAKVSGPSDLRNLITAIMTNAAKNGTAYDKFSRSVEEFSESMKDEETDEGESLNRFQTDLSLALADWDTSFALDFKPPSVPEVIKSMIDWQLTDTILNEAQDPSHYGSGFQRHFIFSLIQLGAAYASPKGDSKAKDFTPSMNLLLFEEPEAFLHPPKQDALARNLRTLVSNPDWQTICTTHSPHFVSRNTDDIPAIIRLRREGGEMRANQISGQDWRDVVDANQAINVIAQSHPRLANTLCSDDLTAEMEAVKYFLWLGPDRANLFFADHVLLVEGQTEVALIGRMLEDGSIASPPGGLYILDCIGKHNIHRFMSLCEKYAIPHSVLHDQDDDKGSYHSDLNNLICDYASKHKYAVCVQVIPGDMESLLDLPNPVRSDRKPQHALYLYEQAKIDSLRLQQLSSIVAACFPS
ncbi:MAG: AAA family ATPase [Chloroflexota bacterium]|nr:AAA family ATPase [Chloroflexota bacterium]